MKNEKIYSNDIKIRINNSNFKLAYSYNNYTTFQDLLEHLARLFDICDCYEFEISGQYPYLNNAKISKDSLISNYEQKLDKLNLYRKNMICNHSNNNYLRLTKKDIYSFFQNRQKLTHNLENKIKTLEEELKLKNKEVNDLKNNLEKLMKNSYDKNAKIDESKNEIKILQNKNAKLIAGINGDLELIQKLKELGIKNDNLKEKENIIKINPETNEIIDNQTYVKPNFVDSIEDITKGWNIKINQIGEQNYRNHKSEKVIKIGVIGNANKGKYFILSI